MQYGNGLDDDLKLTSEDWYINVKLSESRSIPDITQAVVFNSMESQSKTLSLSSDKRSCSAITPLGSTVFKVPLVEIPNFD